MTTAFEHSFLQNSILFFIDWSLVLTHSFFFFQLSFFFPMLFPSWRILDLSVAMAYAMLTCYGKQGRSLSAAAAFLRGYNSVCPITEIEKRHLILLVACRLSCSVTLGAYSYQQNPGNEYLLLHAVPAWNALELIWGTDPDRRASMAEVINKLFDRACSKTGLKGSDVIDCSDLSFPDPSLDDPFASVRGKYS